MLNYDFPLSMIKRQSGGFTLIELMIVIAIVAILVALAVPAYQEYTIRAKVTECMVGAAPAKLGISEFISTTGTWPQDVEVAGISSNGVSKFCNGFVGYDPVVGSFQIDVDESAVDPGLGQVQPELIPSANGVDTISWRCGYGATAPAEIKYLPSTCRGS
jgi:type IV pilus assembly protein PilA